MNKRHSINFIKKGVIFSLLAVSSAVSTAQKNWDTARLTNAPKARVEFHHGALPLAVGAKNYQILRANRTRPEEADGVGWTYNHAPMMAFWKGKFYVQYLSNPVGEHIPPGKTWLMESVNGKSWSKPKEAFPIYKVPDGFKKPNKPEVAKNLEAVMHQRMGFYISSTNRLLTLGYYGIAMNEKDDPNDGNGIGRVVREVYDNGQLGPIYFIRFNHLFNEKNAAFPLYTRSKDRGFVKACEELLTQKLMLQHWNEESDRNDPLIPLNQPYKAFSFYHLPDGRTVGWWKHALTSISSDSGKTWNYSPTRAPGFVNSNAKIWGQQLSNREFATVYNPSEFRWPLAISLSSNGIDYSKLLLIQGEISPMRYGGNYKSFGPQYVRGILPGNGLPPDGNLWVTYSMNKEDIWVATVPVPVLEAAPDPEATTGQQLLEDYKWWNVHSPIWAPVLFSSEGITLKDSDPYEYAKVERSFTPSGQFEIEFQTTVSKKATKSNVEDDGGLMVQLLNAQGLPSFRLEFGSDGLIKSKAGARYRTIQPFEEGKRYTIGLRVNCATRMVEILIDGKSKGNHLMYAPAEELSRISFTTGQPRVYPTPETPADHQHNLENADEPAHEVQYKISGLKRTTSPFLLSSDGFKKYVDYFNAMEDEPVVQAISNKESWSWMEQNIPLFTCPQKNIEEIYYYRWWTFRKNIIKTPHGNAYTEFMVPRSYADSFNLIACAIGHHLREGRWLHNSQYNEDYVKVWYRGLQGGPMKKLHGFSSWTPEAYYQHYLVTGRTAQWLNFYEDFKADYFRWEAENRLPSGLYWQTDVKDGMEETISGGRREKNARPTINSYMYGNAKALAAMAKALNRISEEQLFLKKADTLQNLVLRKLWNEGSGFFEVRKQADSFAQVKEAIGYLPWYFQLPPQEEKYLQAWKFLQDEKCFRAPFGLTTADRSHPHFRTHGCCKCEWDGAVWPFATAQTLTALANVLQSNRQEKDSFPKQTSNMVEKFINKEDYFQHLSTYVESQYYRGKPYIGEYLDEKTGYWLKGDQQRSRHYNHSTYNDLIISGLVGIQPSNDNIFRIHPLLPPNKWKWFALDRVLYHGYWISILWDEEGTKFQKGAGLSIWINGKMAASRSDLGPLQVVLPSSLLP